MITNELILLFHILAASICTIGALALGKEALVACTCLSAILANLFVLKQITLSGLTASGSDAFAVSATLCLNLLQEYVSPRMARKTIWISFYFLIAYTLFTHIHLAYLPAAVDTAHAHYQPLLAAMPRITAASICAYLISQTTDYLLYGLLRRWWQSRWLIIRNYLSLAISQLVDTVAFTYLGLYGMIAYPLHIIAVSYSIKLLVILLATPLVGLLSSFAHQFTLKKP